MKLFSKSPAKRRLLTIRAKLVAVTSLLIGTISLFISIFFPAGLEKQAIKAIADKAQGIAEMTAFSISPALFFEDIETIEEVFESARQNKELVYIVVLDDSERVIAAFNRNEADQADFTQTENHISREGTIYKAMTPILLNNREIGRLYLGLSLRELRAEIGRSRKTIASVSFAVFIIGMIIVFVISTAVTGPLSHMVETVEQISKGDLTRRAAVSSQDEVGYLARSFNLMVDNLESAYTELESLNRSLEKRVEERTKELQQEIDVRKRAEKQLRSLASELSLTEERERRRIAMVLHDRIGQTLAICKIKLGLLRKAATSGDLGIHIDEIRELINQTIQDTRSLTFELSPPILYELGLEAALESLAEQIQEQRNILFHFEDDGKLKPLDDDVRVVLFQAVRELLVNVAKHAQARNVKVSISRHDDNMQISVEDNGVGFDTSKNRTDGFGLFNIRERLDHLGGHLEVRAEPGHGTLVTLTAPLRREQKAAMEK